MPGSASCSDPKECRTNKQAADPISKSFAKYGITTSNEAAALLGIMSMESVDLKYGKNQWPGRPGQGCYNMQMPPFNLEYAKSIKELQPQVEKLTAGHAPDNATYTSVLDLLLANDEYSLGAAAWYYSTKCTDDVKNGLKTGGDQGWSKYITACIQTEANDERKAPYKRALEALGKGNSAPAPASSSSKPYPPAAAPAPAPATAAPPAPISSAPTTTATPASSGSNGTGSGNWTTSYRTS